MQETYTQSRQRNEHYGQQVMSRPPQCITQKDLAYLKDALSWELIAMKKCNHFAQECQNQQIKQAINEAGRLHHRHYRMLMMHLNPAKTMQNNQGY